MGLILNGEMHDTRLDAVSRSEEWVGAIWKLLRWKSCALKTAGLSLGGDRAGQSTQGGLGPRRWGGNRAVAWSALQESRRDSRLRVRK